MKGLKVIGIALGLPSLILSTSYLFIELKNKKIISELVCIVFIGITIISNLIFIIRTATKEKNA